MQSRIVKTPFSSFLDINASYHNSIWDDIVTQFSHDSINIEGNDFKFILAKKASQIILNKNPGIDTNEVESYASFWASHYISDIRYAILKERVLSMSRLACVFENMRTIVYLDDGVPWYQDPLTGPIEKVRQLYTSIVSDIPKSTTGRSPIAKPRDVCRNMWNYDCCPFESCKFSHNVQKIDFFVEKRDGKLPADRPQFDGQEQRFQMDQPHFNQQKQQNDQPYVHPYHQQEERQFIPYQKKPFIPFQKRGGYKNIHESRKDPIEFSKGKQNFMKGTYKRPAINQIKKKEDDKRRRSIQIDEDEESEEELDSETKLE